MEEKLVWWGYKHTEGTLHVKRYWGPLDIQEAKESPFVDQVVGPFEADNRAAAIDKLKAGLSKS